ncbi:L-lactate permease [Nocardia yamanashiensis]|uniref:L-lactate permease n=1 Tax=Nocardia yamanashiensis TaxID=209247 RepID=UPI00082B3662|nr:L-lactate permease [Nocardia yamanashiensis]
MMWVLAVLPLIVVLAMITGLRRPAHWAAAAGALAAVIIVWWRPEFAVPGERLGAGAGAAGLLVLNAAAVMLPGVYLSQVLTRRGVHESLQEWVRALPLSGPAKIALVVAGIAPTVEALTGFGVSLLVTVPVLLALAPPATALRQAMLGMNIMPWGTLGLATVIGAALAGVSVTTLGTATAVTSALIFPLLTVWAALLSRPERRLRTAVLAAGAGGVLASGLLISNRLGVVPPAGVLAGLFTSAMGLALCALRRPRASEPSEVLAHTAAATGNVERHHEINREDRHGATGGLIPPRPVLHAYGLVLGGIAVLRIATAAGVAPLALHTGGASFALLSSPGLPLLAAALLLDRGRPHLLDARAAMNRVTRPLLALTGFVILGRLMADSGMISALGDALANAPTMVIACAAPALGMLSGFVTGSNVGGDVLMMSLQQDLAPTGLGTWFAALQNSAAGHTVFTSLPMIMLILAVAGDRATNAGVSEHVLLRFGLRVAAGIYLVLAAVAIMVMAVV